MNNFSSLVLNKAKNIRLLICDVDGVLTDGKIILGNAGEELKAFNVKDGYGIKVLQNIGVATAIITGRQSELVARRANELGITHLYQNKKDKIPSYEDLMVKLAIEERHIAYIGDDVPDAALIERSGLGVAVADGHDSVLSIADYITTKQGGMGAVRELCDLILTAKQN